MIPRRCGGQHASHQAPSIYQRDLTGRRRYLTPQAVRADGSTRHPAATLIAELDLKRSPVWSCRQPAGIRPEKVPSGRGEHRQVQLARGGAAPLPPGHAERSRQMRSRRWFAGGRPAHASSRKSSRGLLVKQSVSVGARSPGLPGAEPQICLTRPLRRSSGRRNRLEPACDHGTGSSRADAAPTVEIA